MAITNQFPQLALSVRSAALQALVLRAGQVLEAKVLGTSTNGITQVQIGKQVVNLTLPVLIAAGSTLNLQAQGSGAQQKLVLLSQQSPIPVPTPQPQPQPQPSQASRVTVSPQAIVMPQQASVQAQPGTTLALQTNSAQAPQAQPPQRSQPTALPTPAVQSLRLQPGQQVEARVVGPAPSGATQIQIGRQTIEVALPTPLPAGTTLVLRAEGSGAQQRLVLVPATVTGPIAQAQATPGPARQMVVSSIAPTQAPATQMMAAAQSPVPTPQPSTPPPPPTLPKLGPQAALAQMVQSAVQRQDSVANLTTVLSAVVDKVALPPPVLQAAQQVLASSLPLGPALDGPTLQRAIASSGLFQEAMLAQGAPELAKGDLKTTLLVLRNTLVNWLGQSAAVTVPPGPWPPPVRGAVPRARSNTTDPIDIPDEPIEVGKVMLSRAEGSLARLRLHQHASLPESIAPGAAADWSTDIPVLIGNYQTVMQLQIHRDASGSDQAVSERGWQIHFAVDLPKLGEVGAQVGLRGGVTSVRLWATNPTTAADLEQAAPELSLSLAEAGLRPGIIIVRANEPALTPTPNGHFVDTLK